MKLISFALLISLSGSAEAFGISSHHRHRAGSSGGCSSSQQERSSACSPLHLTPQQGKQLVAAYEVECSRQRRPTDEEDGDDGVEEEEFIVGKFEQAASSKLPSSSSAMEPSKLAAARSFVSRVFSIPSTMRHPRYSMDDNENEDMPFEALISLPKSLNGDEDDVVLYPLVGFRIFMVDGKPSVVPTSSQAACRLFPQQQEVFGWWTQSCKLDIYSKDPCQKPSEVLEE
jgi:hypothetical protein